ncbi:tyrosine-type recombinase/integrase [Bacteroides intestinalis]|uniref:tyrosine-type recombinase/integrase n=1 Tax=Bacteroides intestinalis TaxID=329854 RepID=UPI0011073D10|nr:tyrosine-type recombinase/integrase [Bacteroides intestinalis]
MKKISKPSGTFTAQNRKLAKLIYDWHTTYIPSIKTTSEHTLRSYKLSLSLFLRYLQSEKDITPFDLTPECFSVEILTQWQMWLKGERHVSATTCNSRMAAIKNLTKYIGGQIPEYAYIYVAASEYLKPMREIKRVVHAMTRNAVKAIFAIPDTTTKIGLRDLTLMMLSYGVAARLDEVLSLAVKDVVLDNVKDPYVILCGKGGGFRSIYLHDDLVEWLKLYLKVFHGDRPNKNSLLFYSPCKGCMGKLTQPAIAKRLSLYAAKAHEICPDVPLNLHSHLWRHSMATHWREDNINIVEIKELLGHRNLSTTMIYEDVTEEQKRKAIDTLEDTITKSQDKKWKKPENMELLTLVGL